MAKKVGVHTFLEFYSRKIAKIAIPVILTLILDAISIRFIEQTHGSAELNRNFVDTMSRNDSGLSVTTSIITAVVFIGMIFLVTAVLLLLYYFGCMKIIYGWLITAVILLLSMYMLIAFGSVPSIINIPVDYITLAIFLGNLCAVGVMSIFWRAPQIVTQLFLILISILTSLVFRYLPDWTVWILLILLVIYDACVVLCPGGLLNLLLKKSEERGDAIPALIYSTAAYFWHEKSDDEESEHEEDENENENQDNNDENQENINDENKYDGEEEDGTDDEIDTEGEDQNKPQEQIELERQPAHQMPLPDIDTPLVDQNVDDNADNDQEQQQENGERNDPENPNNKKKKNKKKKMSGRENDGIKLGLGDFVFYGILITRAARIGWDITVLCIFAVILGLSLTLIVLAIFERPLPALPFSLVLGIIFFIIGTMTFRQFSEIFRAANCGF